MKEPASFQAFQAGRSLGVIYHRYSWLKASLKGRGTCFIRVSCWERLVGAVFSSGYANSNNSHFCMRAEAHRHPCWLLAYEAAKEIKLFLDVLKPNVGKTEGFPNFGEKETSNGSVQQSGWSKQDHECIFTDVRAHSTLRFTFWEIWGLVTLQCYSCTYLKYRIGVRSFWLSARNDLLHVDFSSFLVATQILKASQEGFWNNLFPQQRPRRILLGCIILVVVSWFPLTVRRN